MTLSTWTRHISGLCHVSPKLLYQTHKQTYSSHCSPPKAYYIYRTVVQMPFPNRRCEQLTSIYKSLWCSLLANKIEFKLSMLPSPHCLSMLPLSFLTFHFMDPAASGPSTPYSLPPSQRIQYSDWVFPTFPPLLCYRFQDILWASRVNVLEAL